MMSYILLTIEEIPNSNEDFLCLKKILIIKKYFSNKRQIFNKVIKKWNIIKVSAIIEILNI